MLLGKLSIAMALVLLLAACGGSDEGMTDEHTPTAFTVAIANTSNRSEGETLLAPEAFVVHTLRETLLAGGTIDRGKGLDALAQDGDQSGLVASLSVLPTVSTSGALANPDGGTEAGPISLGDAGTEVDETAGTDNNQTPRQSGPNTGDAQGAAISAVA